MTTLVQPLGARVLVELATESETAADGKIILARKNDRKPSEGIVRACGANVGSTIVREGTRVLFPRHVGNEVLLDGIEYLIVEVEQIVGVVVDVPSSGGNVVPFRPHDG